jgi:hypothetical protein
VIDLEYDIYATGTFFVGLHTYERLENRRWRYLNKDIKNKVQRFNDENASNIQQTMNVAPSTEKYRSITVI